MQKPPPLPAARPPRKPTSRVWRWIVRVAIALPLLGLLAVIGFYGLPLAYLDDFISRVEAVSVDQVRVAFRRRVHPDQMVTVTVGAGH